MYRRINDLKKGYQPRINIVKDDKGDLVADSQSILARCRNYFSQMLNVHGVSDIRETEIQIHTVEPVVFGLSTSEVELATGKLKSHK